MRALVVYESMFGNTRDVAVAVGRGIATYVAVDTFEVSGAPAALGADIGLLVVGGPTHAHGLTTPKSRADAAQRAGDALVSRGIGIAEWLDALAAPSQPVAAATFDTRIKGPAILWGSAAKAAGKRLRSLGMHLVRPPESFLVEGPTGPLFDRISAVELERARSWAASLTADVVASSRSR